MTISVALAARLSPAFAIDVALDLPADGVTCLLGPSGSGKTTVLRALAGLERLPGTIRFGETTWQDRTTFLPPHRRQVGYVFQGAGLLPHLSVAGNLDYAAKRRPSGPLERSEVIDRTGIAHLLDRMPARLSGGEAQRASIARALLAQPRLLLMDEPLSALDTSSRRELVDHLAALFTAIPVPVVYVTHDESEAERLASRIVRIDAGGVVGSARFVPHQWAGTSTGAPDATALAGRMK